MITDMELVRQYARQNSEAAFAELVSRHINLVYSVALRQISDAHLAQDVTQAVFIILARKAKSLDAKTVLSAWLCRTARYASADALKIQRRRQTREREASMQSVSNESESTSATWEQFTPLLDVAFERLGSKDHAALVLRFFEHKSLSEVGAALGVSEDAAKMRVSRALEKLRKFFAKRGVVSTTAVIAGAVSASSVHAAPQGLAQTISIVAITKGAAAGGSTLALVKGTLTAMNWKNFKIAITLGSAVLIAGTVTVTAGLFGSPNARIPYKMLDDLNQIISGINQSNLVVRMTLWSKNVSSPTNIHLTIQSKRRGPIPLQLANDGQLLNLPHDEELRRENPYIVSDLPKGALTSTFNLYIPRPKSSVIAYRQLGDGVAEFNKALGRAKHDFGTMMLFQKEAKGVVFMYSPGLAGKAKIEIISSKGILSYTADVHGRVKVALDETLLRENPDVRVSSGMIALVPDIE